mgnify:CR=1 FL=1
MGMNQYASMLENGDGIQANKQEAARYYKMSADNGEHLCGVFYAQIIDEGDYKMAIDREKVKVKVSLLHQIIHLIDLFE